MINLAQFGLEENVGLHVILSNAFWWISVILAFVAYRYRHLWNIGNAPWAFLFLTFISFGIRELGHLSTSPYIGSIRYVFGIWSAIFMASAFAYLCAKICYRKKDTMVMAYIPFALAFITLLAMFYLYLSGTDGSSLKKIMSLIENLVWIISSVITIYTTYLLGMHATGGFTRVFMFFQFSAFAAFTWKLLGLIESIGSPIPYSVREVVETLFGIFAIISMYLLIEMLRKLSRHIYSE